MPILKEKTLKGFMRFILMEERALTNLEESTWCY